MLKTLKQTTLFAALSSLIILLCTFHVKGMWVFYDLGIVLWLFALGYMISQLIRIPKWLRIVAMIGGLALLACTGIMELRVPIGWTRWYYLGALVLGLSVPKGYEARNGSLLEAIGLCVTFAFMSAACEFISQRTGTAYVGHNDLLSHLCDWTYGLKVVPLVGTLYCVFKLSMHEKVQALMSNKVIQWEVGIVCVAAFVVCLLIYIGAPNLSRYLINLLLCPATIGIPALIIGKKIGN